MADAHKNFASSLVATAPSPATSDTSLVVTAADGAKFPLAPFNATIWPVGVQPTTTNAEIVRVTAVSTDTFTIVRTQESTSARTVIVGDQISANITARTLTDAENPLAGVTGGTLAAGIDYIAVDSLEVSATDSLELSATATLEIKADSAYRNPTSEYNPCKFLVYRAGALTDGNGAFAGITFDTKVFDTNNNYSTSTGNFTAPVSGYYQFNWTISKSQTSNTAMLSSLLRNGVTYASLSNQAYQGATTGGAGTGASCMIYLDKGDTVKVQSYGSGGAISVGLGSFGGTAFSGFLVSAT